jgi:hypothetical protein
VRSIPIGSTPAFARPRLLRFLSIAAIAIDDSGLCHCLASQMECGGVSLIRSDLYSYGLRNLC